MPVDAHFRTDLDHWNQVAPIHERSLLYDVEGFKAGKLSLTPLELEELGEVAGKSLLHLQCHFGLDTLSWARLGARVTGVDFSDKAITLARSLAEELGIGADFVLSDVYDLPNVLDETFDVAFTSYGVLSWLPDLEKWAQVSAHFLKPGGIFYIAELHTYAAVFYDGEDAGDLQVSYPYFHTAEPTKNEADGGTYAVRDAGVTTPTYSWSHSLSDVVNALISAGLRIEFLHEFPYCMERLLPLMEQGQDGWWRLKEKAGSVPLTFSIKATKG